MPKADSGLIPIGPFSWATGIVPKCLRFFLVWVLVAKTVVVINGESPSRAWNLPDLVLGADLVAVGRVESKTVTPVEKVGIETTVELELEEVWKGSREAKGSISFFLPGGVLGERKVVVSGQPEFILNEACVVFLKRADDGRWVLVGFGQGKLGVEVGPVNRDRWVLAAPRMRIAEFKRRVKDLNSELQ